MGKLSFCEDFVVLKGQPMSFAGRPYLPAIYAAQARNLVLRCSRQTEKSTYLVNTILYEACTNPRVRILFVCPRLEQAYTFCRSRLIPSLEGSPLVRRVLLGQGARRRQLMTMEFVN